MDFSSQEGKGKNKVAEVKIFHVPFALGEIKENINITTNKPSKEQIINQALKFHSQGKISEASKYYQYFINQGFKDYIVFSNYSLILENLGKLEEAELSIREAIKLKPDLAEAHVNLGIILKGLSKLEEAELSLRKAIEIKSDLAEAHSNLGNVSRDLGKLIDAEISHRKAIALKPDLAEAYSNLGNVLIDLGKLKEFINLSKSILKKEKMNMGNKLLISIDLSICNLIQGELSSISWSINKTKDLIKQGGINHIKKEHNRKNALVYYQLISSIYIQIKNNNHISILEKIPHIGESHCLSFAHQSITISSNVKRIQPVLIKGGKAWHFANQKQNQWKDSLTQQIKNHSYSDYVFISFGEIDCRNNEGILNYAIKNHKDISEVCEETIKGFLDYMEEILTPNYSKKYYFGIPAPTIGKEFLNDLDIKRINMIQLYNFIFKKEVLYRGSYFLDVYKLTSNNEGVNNNIHMCDDTHLSPKCLSILFENYLYKSYV